MKLLDSCFLIDLQREARSGTEGAAHAYLRMAATEHLAISTITSCEFLEGFPDPRRGEVFLAEFRQLSVDAGTAREAARIRRALRLSGQLIGDFDILIAATAIQHQLALVTENRDHFQRVENLVMESYK